MSAPAASVHISAEGLSLHAVERPGPGPKLLLLHGWLDHARGFDWVMERLPERFHLLALDLRGHGRSEHLGPGALYHLTDFVADAHAAVMHLGGRAHLLGHSMGGAVGLMYAAAAPERVSSLLLVETIGPLGGEYAKLVQRMRRFVGDLGKPRRKRRYASVEEAAARVRENNPSLPEPAALHLTRHGVRPVEGGFEFTFDPLLRRSFGHAYDGQQVLEILRAVRCPVRVVRGDRGFQLAEDELRERLVALRHPEVVVLEGGHHVHLERPGEIARTAAELIAAAEGTGGR